MFIKDVLISLNFIYQYFTRSFIVICCGPISKRNLVNWKLFAMEIVAKTAVFNAAV